ncbi:hypothetical protein SCLAR_v1c11940 [Spiroplasma clarkii]|uniref:Uncharacterized protein n=3 Tax=Spiroplasma clarkii TaxID=2139 RepID=A0A2K8KNU9_9MOLU|nr:hypothetical protein SCLAR_v1c11940 [Spiroplasma clarkii]
MFLRNLEDLGSYFKRTEYLKYLDENNLNHKSRWYIKKISRLIQDKKALIVFKHWLLWRWINKNFELTEKFSAQLKHNLKKLKISANAKEEAFLLQLEELVFNSWRPLKELPVKFEIAKKEQINLIQTNVIVHRLVMGEKNLKPKMIGDFDIYFSNKKMYLTNENQEIFSVLAYEDIIEVKQERYGLIISTKYENFLYRGRNRLLTYLLLQRMVPSLHLDIAKLDDLYQYFDYWNKIINKIY